MTVRPWVIFSTIGSSAFIYISYNYISDTVDRNSSLIKQTIHNLAHIKQIREHTGGECQVASRIVGDMLQRKGFADVTFDVDCRKGPFSVHLIAHRQGINWTTDQLTLYQNGQECYAITDINNI